MTHQRTNQQANNIHRQHDDWDEVHGQLLAIQKKSLVMSDPGDADEKEADAIASKVAGGAPAGVGENENEKTGGEKTLELTETFPTVTGHTFSTTGNLTQKYTINKLITKLGVDGATVGINHPSETMFQLSDGLDLTKYKYEIKRTKTGYAAQGDATLMNATEYYDHDPDDPTPNGVNVMVTPNAQRQIFSMDAPGFPWTSLKALPSTVKEVVLKGNFEEHVEITHIASGEKVVDPYIVKWQVSVWVERSSVATNGWIMKPGLTNWVKEGHQQMPANLPKKDKK